MNDNQNTHSKPIERSQRTLSLRSRDGSLLEAILRGDKSETMLLKFDGVQISEHQTAQVAEGRFEAYGATNNLLTHDVVLLPSAAEEYGSVERLVEEVRAFIHRYVDLEPEFELVAAHYVLMTWGYDVFDALPYLRVRGDYGSGKSRFLLTVGSVCYKPIFASGASTVSPLFRLMDQVGGTLIVDEADFWASDERAEIVKILNNGNARGFPVLRSEVTPNKEFNPRAFNIFGPKVIATRHRFQDEALESRCITHEFTGRKLRSDIPITLPKSFNAEAQSLRNKLLQFRFERFFEHDEAMFDCEVGVPPRRSQILAPLMRVCANAEFRKRIVALIAGAAPSAEGSQAATERRVLKSVSVLLESCESAVNVSMIAKQFDQDWRHLYGAEASPRWIGSILRGVGLRPQKSNGVFVLPTACYPELRALIERRLGDERDNGDGAGAN